MFDPVQLSLGRLRFGRTGEASYVVSSFGALVQVLAGKLRFVLERRGLVSSGFVWQEWRVQLSSGGLSSGVEKRGRLGGLS